MMTMMQTNLEVHMVDLAYCLQLRLRWRLLLHLALLANNHHADQITYSLPGIGIPHTAAGLEDTTSTPSQQPTDTQPSSAQLPPSLELPERTTSTLSPLPPESKEVYESQPHETFEQQRLRVNRQETLSFRNPETYGPVREATSRATPYSKTGEDDINVTIDVDVTTDTKLPHGWRVEDGYIVLDDVNDDWIINDKYLIHRHFLPRNEAYVPSEETCPIPLKYLHKNRTTHSAGRILHDKWTRPSKNRQLHECWWTCSTRFKIQTPWRSQAHANFAEKSEGFETVNSVAEGPINERYMSLADRKLFTEAKQKELESFFNNQVWHFSPASEADPQRVLKARFLLNWKKHADGSPRAKARLIVQGFRDPDALNGTLNTASPTLTRLSRNFILTVATMQSFNLFTADITTAFLQGKEFPDGSDRVIWIKLPRDGERLLGLEGEHGQLMKLTKPMYGLCDAPRAWFEEATERILQVGDGRIVQHPLDACLFMAYEEKPTDACPSPKLLGMFCLHVDDLFGCFHPSHPVSKEIQDKIHQSFSFREWIMEDKLEYCGSTVTKVSHEKYMSKQKPITIAKDRQHQDLPVTESERTQLRGLLGALQWPATQTSPHLQAGVSLLCGEVTKATTKTLEAANKLLRFAKSNADVGLDFRYLGDKENVTFAVYSDASFACRTDLSSQGGYMVVMIPREVAEGQAGHYVVVDWRSWKLQRVARSTLCAESQAASEAADALLYTTTFWNLVWKPHSPLDALETSQMPINPRLIVDAKALYDLLIKPEVQAASSSDKRTTIEVLVTRDKLACNKAKTMWISSELQYADGLTKDSAAQLLADRLRSHLTKLKADDTFQAAKKKDAVQRKKNAEMYAIKKPKRAMKAMLATVLWTTCRGQEEHEPIIYIDQTNDIVLYLLVTIIVILMGNLYMPGIGPRLWEMMKALFQKELPEPELEPEDPPELEPLSKAGETSPRTKEVGIQAVADEVDLYREIHHHTNRANFYLKELEDLRTRVEVDHTRRKNDYQEKIQEMHRHMTQQNIYITRNGECWQADFACAERRTLNQAFGRRPCQACSHRLAYPGNRPANEETDLIVRDVLGEEPEARPAPLDRREMAKQIHEFVRQSGGRVTIANVGKQFANKIGTEKTQMEKNTFVQGLALEFRDLLDCNNQHIMMPAPKNAPVSAGPGPTQEAQTVRSLKDIEWLDGTTWKEVRYPAKYRISRIFNGKPGACFRVDKIIGSAHPYAITLYWDSKGKKLYYGDKYKWYLSMLTTDGRLNWSGKDDQVAYEWQIVGSAPKTPAEAAKQAAARPEEYPALPSAKAAPSSQAKREDSWSNSEPWGKQAAAKSEPHEADSGDSHDEVPPPPPEAPPAQGPVMKWFKYLAHDSDSAWWSCGYDERKWFYEGDQRWIKFQVPDGHPSGAGRTYFWNEDTQECFFEDTGDVIGGGA
eukprot:symbB.v1.2.018628.t1/scaffold1494.1/size117378/12